MEGEDGSERGGAFFFPLPRSRGALLSFLLQEPISLAMALILALIQS